MKFEIKNRYSGKLIIAVEAESWRFAVELAIKQGADLRNANLSIADLSNADLRHADLSIADLRYADLRHADLRYADLSNADLRNADIMMFQFHRHTAYYTFDGALRIGCLLMPVNEWALGFEEIGEKEGYTEEQVKHYGKFINQCLAHFKESTK